MDINEYFLQLVKDEDWEAVANILKQIEYDDKYRIIRRFSPYDYQKELFDAGKNYMSRFACFSNRCGKTFSGAREMAWHLTGKYPEWWDGYKFDRPIKAWAIGITGDSTRKVLQYELLGSIDVRQNDELGSTAISRDDIKLDSLEKDGAKILVARIKHYDSNGMFDGESILEFRSTQQGVHTLMGTSQDFIWLDEEDEHSSMEIYSQCMTRLATTNGRLLMTATPENGLTSLIQKFMDTPEKMWIGHVGWDRVPHLTEEMKETLIASYPVWEIPLRTQGIPSAGSGAIFQVLDEEIQVPPMTPHGSWPIVCGVDFGRSKDPSTIVYATKDVGTGQMIVFHEEYLDKDRSLEAMAKVILSSPWPQIPVIVPHDGNGVATDGGTETRANILRRLGCNVLPGCFSNPIEIQNSIMNPNKKSLGKEGGLAWMAYKFNNGSLKVCQNLLQFFREKRSYFYIERGGKSRPKDGDDHVIDATRIAVLSLDRFGRAADKCGLNAFNDNNGFDYEPNTSWE